MKVDVSWIFKSSLILNAVLIVVVGYFVYIDISSGNDIDRSAEVLILTQKSDSLSKQIAKRDSAINKLKIESKQELDSITEASQQKEKEIVYVYKNKIIDVDSNNIDDDIRLFTELLSKKDSVPE